MPRLIALIAGLMILTAEVASCTDSTASPGCTEATSQLTVSISDGLTPKIAWSPACKLSAVTIREGSEFLWYANSYPDDGTTSDVAFNRISSPVTYGVRPEGASDSQPPLALQKGHTYTIELERVFPPGNTSPCVFRYGEACVILEESFTR